MEKIRLDKEKRVGLNIPSKPIPQSYHLRTHKQSSEVAQGSAWDPGRPNSQNHFWQNKSCQSTFMQVIQFLNSCFLLCETEGINKCRASLTELVWVSNDTLYIEITPKTSNSFKSFGYHQARKCLTWKKLISSSQEGWAKCAKRAF